MNSDEAASVILQLYDLMDDIAQDRLEQIWKQGKFVQEGYKKKATTKAKTLKGFVNTIIGSVQREVNNSMTR